MLISIDRHFFHTWNKDRYKMLRLYRYGNTHQAVLSVTLHVDLAYPVLNTRVSIIITEVRNKKEVNVRSNFPVTYQ